MRKLIFCLCCLLWAIPACAGDLELDLECLQEAYPGFITGTETDDAGHVWFLTKNGGRLLYDDGKMKSHAELLENADIFSKINVPKYLFLFSKNIQSLINLGLTLIIFFLFCILDGITFTWKFILLLYPVVCLILFNIGVGLILSALFVFFRDVQYLWNVFTQLLMYMSAIFYTIDNYSYGVQCLFLTNPVYLFIRYFRKIVIEATIPTVWFHLLMLADVVIVLGIGCWIYKKYNHRFLYYI